MANDRVVEGESATPLEEYLFDLQGFVILEGALTEAEVADCNGVIDQFPRGLRAGEAWGEVRVHSYSDGADGVNLQQIYEAGQPFERLIDHPKWIRKVQRFVGGEDSFDSHHGPMFIDENFVSLRGPGEAIGLHSGAADHTLRGQFAYFDGKFVCGQVNVLVALTDIAEGDGATMVIPGSHKSNLVHPDLSIHRMDGGKMRSVEGTTGAIEVHLKSGDALIFVDSICHGSAERHNSGERRITVSRYGPSWGYFRHKYRPSDSLMRRLTPTRRKIVNPHYDTA